MDIEIAIHKWFDMKYKTYDKLEYENSIYFYYEGEDYANIRIEKETKTIYHKLSFRDEFFEIFPVELSDFERFMTKWVEDTFGLKGFTPDLSAFLISSLLKIPSV